LKKIILALAILLVISSLLTSCNLFSSNPLSSNPTNSGTSSSGVLNLNGVDPLTLDPAGSNDVGTAQYILQIFSGLLRFDDNLKPVPDIAAGMPVISADGLVYTFKLRQDVKFQDGTPVKAGDFKYSWERAVNPATQSPTAGTYLGDIAGVSDVIQGKSNQINGVKIIDDFTLQVTLNSNIAYFLNKMTYPTTFVVEKKNVESNNEWWRKAVGTGPFRLKSWTQDASLILERNDQYYGEKAKLNQVKFTYNSTSSDMDLYETDQIDMVGVSTAYYDKVMDKSQPFYNDLIISPYLSIDYIGFNCGQAPFDDINIRRAFSMSIDKDKIVSLVNRDMTQKANGILPPGMPGYNQNVAGTGYDVNQAKDLIKASKYGYISKLPEITMSIPGEGGGVSSLIESLVYQWKQNLGVNVRIRQLEPELYNVLGQEVDQMFYFGWIADYPHPQDFLDILFGSGSAFNYSKFSDSAVDSLIRQANHELNENLSYTLYQQAEQKIIDEAACLPILFNKSYILVQPYVKDLRVNALGFISFDKVSISPH
jgi:oligopeptide transport system substrate-binding protein